MVEVVFHLLDLFLDVKQLILSLFDIEFGDFTNRFLAKLEHVIASYFFLQLLTVRVECLFDGINLSVIAWRVFFQDFIDSFLKENLLKRDPMPLTLKLFESILKLPAQQIESMVSVMP